MIINRDKTAIALKEILISYSELLMKVTQFSRISNQKAGEKTVIFSENRVGWIYAFYSIWNNNGIAVPVDSSSTASEFAFILKDCEPEIVWVSDNKIDVAKEAFKMSGITPSVHIIDKETEKPADNLIMADIKQNDDDIALIMYTSGTTGSPKGVMLTFKNIKANVKAVSEEVPIFNADRCVMILLPLHHVLPLVGSLIAPLSVGATTALSPSMAADDIMATLQNNRVSIIIGVPKLYSTLFKGIYGKIERSFITRFLYKLAKTIGSRSFSRTIFKSVRQKMGGSITYLVSGGAALDKRIGEGFKTLGLDVLEGYGMTEAAPMISFTRPDEISPGVSGKPMPSVLIEIRDGEICAKGENIMVGYYNRPEETADILRDGWLYTGDFGYLNKKGELVITGRKKEIIILSNGKNVNPIEIEQGLERYTAYVKEAGVLQVKDMLYAIIVPSEQADINFSAKELIDKIKWEVIEPYNRSVSAYKKIMNFNIHNEDLPRTRLDKLKRYKLEELISQTIIEKKRPSDISEPDDQVYKILSKFISEEKNCIVLPTDHIELDLALDSLEKLALQTFIQASFGMEISSKQMGAFTDISEMARFINIQKTRIEIETIDWKNILREKVTVRLPKSWFTGRLFIKTLKPFMSLYFGLKAKGVENIPNGPVIIAPNHQSFLDGLFVASFLKWETIKNTYFYAKEQHVKHPLVRAIANRHNVIIMNMNNLKDSIQKLSYALKKQKNIIIFPEGTRTQTGNLGEFKKTFAILSKELNVPVVPVSITGAYASLPKGSRFIRPSRKIFIEFLKPIYAYNCSYDTITDNVFSSIKQHQLGNLTID
ncbi:MAG TPA: AMP-binding protein [Bacteroidaceae bacterium]|nr:AMP-binding protein [Bacteroidaceae bacterium]